MGKLVHNKQKTKEPESWFIQGSKNLLSIPLAAAAGWIAYSHLAIDHNLPLPEALPGKRQEYNSPAAGKLCYYASREGQGRPVVLIHSINAAASSYEMRPLYLHYRERRPVFALDLPGFGFSDRSKRKYLPGLYVKAIQDFLINQVGEPADVVALSLSSEFCAQAALERPELFFSLVMISPSGFNSGKEERASQQASRSGWSQNIYPALSFPIWARPLYDLLTIRASIEFFLKQSFVGPPDPGLVEYDYATAHQPGAENAPLAFISGRLFTHGIRRTVYERIQVPTLVLYDRDNFVNFGMLPEALAKNSYMQAVRLIPSLGLPHFEQTGAVVDILDHFWE